jgi:UDP-N-acetylglucosamine/UDP-N-acetylgalactosamine diphosphorylase
MYPISPVKHKTLFQLFAEKTLAASCRANKKLPLAIMTSPENHGQTLQYFQDNGFFGLDSGQVRFFPQGTLPFLDQKGNLFLESPFRIAQGPDGNGSALTHFVRSGIWEEWYANDVRFLNMILVDNALADPFDEELLGFHYRRGNDVTVKCTRRNSVDEKVGVLTGDAHSMQVVEYMELPPEERLATQEDGALKHQCANLSLFCMNMEFVQDVAGKGPLPLHLAFKPAKFLSPDGETVLPDKPNAWKFERFIFDILPSARKAGALMYPREKCFAPLKNAEGEGNPSSVKIALQAYDREVLAQITGLPSPSWSFELSQDFHYPTHALLDAWKGRTPPHKDYITP